MHELSGKIIGLSQDWVSGGTVLTLSVNEKATAKACVDELRDAELSIKIGKYRNKRSNDANAYLWLLCTKLADKLSDGGVMQTKEDIYREAVKARGIFREQGELPLDFAKTSRTAWEMLGVGWITEQVDFEPDGDRVIVRYYYGSSTYNTKQMSRVIDWLVAECEQLGIETKSPDQIADMLSLWKGAQ